MAAHTSSLFLGRCTCACTHRDDGPLAFAGGRLHQQPVPELAQLRSGAGYTAEQLAVTAQQPVTLQGVSASSLDLELTLSPDGAHASSVVLRSWLWASRGEEWLKDPSAAAISVDWEHGLLQASQAVSVFLVCALFVAADWEHGLPKAFGAAVR